MKHMNEYRHMMDSLQVPDEQQQRMLETVLAQAGKSVKKRPRRHIFRTIAVVAAAISILMSSACTTDILKSVGEIFAPIFGTQPQQTQMHTSEQIQIIEQLGRKIENASVTSQGVTISADAIVGDPYKAYIAYTVSWDNTVTFIPEHFTLNNSINCIDADPSDNKIQYIQSISSMQIDDLSKFTAEAEDMDIGHWELTFDARYPDTTVTLRTQEKIQMDGYEVEIDNINVSPMGIRLCHESRIKIPKEDMEEFCSIPVAVIKTDGSEIKLTPSKKTETFGQDGESWGGSSYTSCSRAWAFDEITPLSEIKMVKVGEIECPIKEKSLTTKQLDLINEIGRTIEGVSVTDNGATLSVDGVLSDGCRTLISYTFSWDERTDIKMPAHILNTNDAGPWDEKGRRLTFEESETKFDTVAGGSHGISRYIDENPTDQKIQLIQIIEMTSEIKNLNNLAIDFKNFSYYDDADESMHPIIEGEWALTFNAACKDTTIWLAKKETFNVEGMEIIVNRMSISPLGIHWNYETDDPRIAQLDTEDWTEEQVKTGFELVDAYRNIPIFYTKTDGTKIDIVGDIQVVLNQPGGNEKDPSSRIIAIGAAMYNFDEIMPLDEIKSITFGEITYTVPHE